MNKTFYPGVMPRKGWVSLLLLLSCASPALHTQAAGNTENPAPVEEITITGGARDIFKLEAQTFKAEQDIYKLFSDLNDNTNYDVVCHDEKPTGSHLSHTNCRPNFMDKILMQYGGGDPRDMADIIPPAVLQREMDQLQKIMAKLAAKSPELREAIATHAVLAKKLKEQQEQLGKQ